MAKKDAKMDKEVIVAEEVKTAENMQSENPSDLNEKKQAWREMLCQEVGTMIKDYEDITLFARELANEANQTAIAPAPALIEELRAKVDAYNAKLRTHEYAKFYLCVGEHEDDAEYDSRPVFNALHAGEVIQKQVTVREKDGKYEMSEKSRYVTVDLLEFEKSVEAISKKYGVEEKKIFEHGSWKGQVEIMAMWAINAKKKDLDAEYAAEYKRITQFAKMHKSDPTSNTSLLRQGQTIMDEVLFEGFENRKGEIKNKFTFEKKDLVYFQSIIWRRGQRAKTLRVPRYDICIQAMTECMSRIVSKGKYSIVK